jgi:hypothetical protein
VGKWVTKIDKIERVSIRVSGGIPGVASCDSSLGVSFAHAFDAIVPSVGSSAVIVLRAISSCHPKHLFN